MIPTKRTSNSFPPEGWKHMTSAEKDAWIKLHPIRKSTELQKLAQKENFALFQIAGILGNLNRLQYADCSILVKDRVHEICENLKEIQDYIKLTQRIRKDNRKNSNG